MILSITIENCLSFKEPTTLSFVAESDDKRNAIDVDGIFVNRSAILFGANASGKTNFLKALQLFFNRLRYSYNNDHTITRDKFDISSGTFKTDSSELPSVSFFHQGGASKFTINFTVDDSNVFSDKIDNNYRFIFAFDSEKICYEELLVNTSANNDFSILYSRELIPTFDSNNNCWQYNYKYSENIKLLSLLFNQDQLNNKDDLWHKWKIFTSDNQSFLIVATMDSCYQLRSVASSLVKCSSSLAFNPWFYNEFPVIQQAVIDDQHYVIKYLIENHFFSFVVKDGIKEFHPNKVKLLKFLHSIGNRFDDIGLDQFNRVRVVYEQYQHLNNPPYFVAFESSGTIQSLFLYQKFHQAITNNMLLVIDEIEIYLHANLCEKLIREFHDSDSKAQLIITSQSPLLCDDSLFSREQINFLERNAENATEIYKMTDIEGQDELYDIAYQYLGGAFGAIPDVTEVEF